MNKQENALQKKSKKKINVFSFKQKKQKKNQFNLVDISASETD